MKALERKKTVLERRLAKARDHVVEVESDLKAVRADIATHQAVHEMGPYAAL